MSNLKSSIRDNHKRGSVGDFLKSKIKDGSSLSIVSAYFTIHAFQALKESLTKIKELRFLYGEPRFIKNLDPEKTDKKAFKIEGEAEGLKFEDQLKQNWVAKACAEWIREKTVEIRSIQKSNLMHAKMYHIANSDVEDAIVGSSNFTVRGLGMSATDNNIELNLEVDSNRDRSDVKSWFDDIWDDKELVEDVKDEVLLYLEQLYQNNIPEFIYYKTLYHIFERFLGEQEKSGLLAEDVQLVDTVIWNTLFEFQKDAVKGAINKIQQHNGCIIADSVGLGKTFEALAIIKYFELLNNRVLVLCPKKLRDNWTEHRAENNSELNQFLKDRFAYTVLSHTDLSRDSGKSGDVNLETINWGNYDLVVIDESHNFRNNTPGKKDEDGNLIRKSRYQRLMEDIIQSGIKTKVLLLSATPVNNNLKDLRNQIYFLTEGQDDAFLKSLGIDSLQKTLADAQRIFTDWAKQQDNRQARDLLERLSSTFFKLLDELTIARSRKHIEKYYPESLKELGGFPERSKPISVYTDIDLQGQFMSYDELNEEISEYQLSLFNPSKYILPEYISKYDVGRQVGQFTQSDREHYLIGMMKVNFLKRLESSVHSFGITMGRTIEKIERLEKRIKRFQEFRGENPEMDLEDVDIEALEDEDLQEAMQVGKKLIFKMAHLDTERWLKDLQNDREQLELPHLYAKDVTDDRDAKLAKLKKLIAKKVKEPTKNKEGKPNRKVLVFTAFADTAKYLYDALEQWATEDLGVHIGRVSGGTSGNKTTFGRTEFGNILTNFSPKSKKRHLMKTMPQDKEIDLLIGTDCISEGQNLQDCDYLINYDIHWNPVRIIQRFGRIDRIGNSNNNVQLVNFWPTPDLNRYIKLKNRVEARMALVDIAATQGDNLLEPEGIQELLEDDLKYRDQQLLKLKDEVLDLEDFNESVALNEFTLDDFRIDLMNYIESNRKTLEDAPFGLYAVVPPDPKYQMMTKGVIFCLQQKGDSEGNEKINPLQPYFLVYIREDGEVRFTFAQPKQILEMYRLLCADVKQAYEELCNLFDDHTDNGTNMTHYNDLLQRAVKSLSRTYQKRAVSNLLSGRGGKLVKQQKQIRNITDFELITWLVIQ
ncbi:ATP-dependent helicase [Candidatus Poribacteria bacterium]|nr:ATP-dependent helicase [Candidatus Poribacteria bacterium]MYA58650.1 ATP-dependent helicase [Candidatus Poribacteria bacterium]